MSSDFVVIPPAKSGNSVRLKGRNIRELRMETLQLEKHNKDMEQKLNQLRQSMSREKEERERLNPYHWISGQAGNQRNDKENIGKVPSGKMKLKVLQTPLQEPEKQKTLSRTTSVPAAEKPKIKGKACGQCESKSALLMCLECGEDYCTACFARFHQKGALKLHRTMPTQEKSQDGKLDISHAFKRERNVDEASGKVVKDKKIIGSPNSTRVSPIYKTQQANGESFISEPRRENSLLHGKFSEEESAKYFNEALLEWRRNKSQPVNVLKVETDDNGSLEVQTVLTATAKPLHIEFKENSLSYMEKLMLKKHRRTPVSQDSQNHLQKVSYSLTISENELDKYSDLTVEEMEAHENYVALFRAEQHVRNDVIHEPALKIVELDEDSEEKLDESRNCVVQETENNERNNQPSLSEHEIKLPFSARVSPKSPERACKKKGNGPPRSTYCVEEGVVKSTSLKASRLQDSKSMKYKSFEDSRSLDTALMVNVPQEPQSTVLRQLNRISEYQGLKGFFMLDIDPVEVKAEHCQPPSPDLTSVAEKVTYTGNNYWRPESSLSVCADDAVVQDIVEKAWEQSNNHIIDTSLTPRNFTHRGTANTSRRPYSSKSIHGISGSYSSPRPRSAAARPMSRAASEISEIESIDSTDRGDFLFEDENERETLAILEKEFDSLHIDNRTLQTSAFNNNSFQLTRHDQRLAMSEDEAPVSRLPLHALQSCAVESESDEEETLQDKLNVLSLQ
ncbi:zinc finger B-box domain-containing protein 1 isoform X2 [Hyla sarda]|uniref:zinc finger B-box domain-containing protein 1 isoform X2 n=1 Tax=Hyla sarda TaxID=327740 RepID=UPI0024C2122C|nr:zinc finger B-box domain-containing protein 1 isoform X2 [Hyla sarda]